MMICIQCTMRAMLDKLPPPTFEGETFEEHMAKYHPDPVVTRIMRREMEKLLAERIMSDDKKT